jgi:hypothetical protein
MDLIQTIYDANNLKNIDNLLDSDFNLTDADGNTIDNNDFLRTLLIAEDMGELIDYFSAARTNTATTTNKETRRKNILKYFIRVWPDVAQWVGTKKYIDFIITNFVYMTSTLAIDGITTYINDTNKFYYVVVQRNLSMKDWEVIKRIIHPAGFKVLFINNASLGESNYYDLGRIGRNTRRTSNVEVGWMRGAEDYWDMYGGMDFESLTNQNKIEFCLGYHS